MHFDSWYGRERIEARELNKNGLYWLISFHTWPQKGIVGITVLKKVCHWGWALRLQKIHTVLSVLSLCFMIVDQDDLVAMPFPHHYGFCFSETVTPIEHFLLVVLVMVFCLSNRKVTNTPPQTSFKKKDGSWSGTKPEQRSLGSSQNSWMNSDHKGTMEIPVLKLAKSLGSSWLEGYVGDTQ